MSRASLGLLLTALFSCAWAQAAPRSSIQIITTPQSYALGLGLAGAFAKSEPFPEPRIEAVGDALARFCADVTLQSPDAVISDQELSPSERAACRAAGVTPVEEVLGYSGIAILTSVSAPALPLTLSDLVLAIAGHVRRSIDGVFVDNPFDTWASIDSKLPAVGIQVIGPPAGSPAEAAVARLIQAAGSPLPGSVRAAPAYRARAAGEDPAHLVSAAKTALVLVDLTTVAPRGTALVPIDGVVPQGSTLASGAYPLARPVRLVVKREHLGIVPGLGELAALAGRVASARESDLAAAGLVAAPARGR